MYVIPVLKKLKKKYKKNNVLDVKACSLSRFFCAWIGCEYGFVQFGECTKQKFKTKKFLNFGVNSGNENFQKLRLWSSYHNQFKM